MNRISKIGLVCFGLVVGAGCQTIQFQQPNLVSDKDWLMDGGEPNRARNYASELNAPLSLEWEYNAAAAFGQGSPLILKGVVLVATKKGEVHAIELETGAKRGIKNFGEGIEASPVIHNGKLFVASALGKRILVAFDLKNGNFVWRNKGVPIESGMVITDEVLIAADIDGTVSGYNMASGEAIWSMSLGQGVSVQSSILQVGEDAVFVATDAGKGFLLNASTGSQIWSQTLAGPNYEGGSVFGNTIVVPTTRGVLEALDASTGNVLWRNKLTNSDVRFGGTAIDSEFVLVGATDGLLRAIRLDNGHLVWETDLSDAVSAAPLISNGLVYVGSMGRKLFALDRESGAIQWETLLKGRVKSAMAVSNNGLLVLSEPRYVSYFKEATHE